MMPLMSFEDLFICFQDFELLGLIFRFSMQSGMLEIEIRKDMSHNFLASGSGQALAS